MAAVERADVAWCWPVRYELMVDARGTEGIAALDRTLERLREVPVDRAVKRGVLSAMRELADSESHGAVAAQQSGLKALHHDRHFERLADLLGVTRSNQIQVAWANAGHPADIGIGIGTSAEREALGQALRDGARRP